MRRIASAAGWLVIAVTWANAADVRVFVTPRSAGYGLSAGTAASMFRPTFSDTGPALDYTNGGPDGRATYSGFRLGDAPPAAYSSGTPAAPTLSADGEYYVWVQFRDIPAASACRVQGLTVAITGGPLLDVAYYLMNDTDRAGGDKRWDGAVTPGAPELRNNPQSLVAVNAMGISKLNADVNPNYNLMKWQAGAGTAARTSVALLGAVKVPAAAVYQIQIINIAFAGYAAPVGDASYFAWVPEPASLLLAALAAVLLRRRG
jgi:hypothetical protein